MNNLYEKLKLEINQKRDRELDALEQLRPMLDSLSADTQFSTDKVNVNTADGSIAAKNEFATNSANGNREPVGSVPSFNERITKQISTFVVGEVVAMPDVFNAMAVRYDDVKNHPKVGNLRSQITNIMNEFVRKGKLEKLSKGKASEPNKYRVVANDKNGSLPMIDATEMQLAG